MARRRGVRAGGLFGVRHALTPVAAYFLGRSLSFDRAELRRIGALILATATAVALWGLVDIYAISLQFWRDSGVPGWFQEQLGLEYRGLSGLPENFVYNPGDERPLRRLVSTFLSPLATAYLLMVAILVATTWQRSRWFSALSGLLLVGLLFTYSRTTIVALVFRARRARVRAAQLVAGRRGGGARGGIVLLHPGLPGHRAGDEVHGRGARDPAGRRAGGGDERRPVQPERVVDREPSGQPARRHRDSASHPHGYGVGNAGVTAKRTGVDIKAGESTYTELGVELGIVGMLAFIAWNLSLLWRILPRRPGSVQLSPACWRSVSRRT